MDIYCPVCGEPWDNESLHEEVALRNQVGEDTSYAVVSAEFRRDGCKAFREFGASPCTRPERTGDGMTRADMAASPHRAPLLPRPARKGNRSRHRPHQRDRNVHGGPREARG